MTHSDCNAITPNTETVSERLTRIFLAKKFKSVDLLGDSIEITFEDGTTVEFCLECFDWDAFRLQVVIDDRGEWHELLNASKTRL